MFGFILKKILGKALPVALAWSSLYPRYDGLIVARQVNFGDPLIAQAKRVSIDLAWGSAFSEQVRIEQADLYDVSANISLDDPSRLIRCLQQVSCPGLESSVDARSKKTATAAAAVYGTSSRPQPSEHKLLRLLLETIYIHQGKVNLIRDGSVALILSAVDAEAVGIPVPLE
ncbi:MAG: hypothetical protein KDD44_13390, partial [Bdellovibrionales bacterium]|nr:hypothetical protein [Bdellovibrionales bacterium]